MSDIDGQSRGALNDASKGFRLAQGGKVQTVFYRDERANNTSVKAIVGASMSAQTYTATLVLNQQDVVTSATCFCTAGYDGAPRDAR